jgi:hypothetical protein
MASAGNELSYINASTKAVDRFMPSASLRRPGFRPLTDLTSISLLTLVLEIRSLINPHTRFSVSHAE